MYVTAGKCFYLFQYFASIFQDIEIQLKPILNLVG